MISSTTPNRRSVSCQHITLLSLMLLVVLAGCTKRGDADPQAGQQPAQQGDENTVYEVTFRASGSFAPQQGGELLDAFNEDAPSGVPTRRFRHEMGTGGLVAHIQVTGVSGKDALVAMLAASNKLELVSVEPVSGE